MLPSEIVERLKMRIELDRLRAAVREIGAKYPFTDERRQLSLMHRSERTQSITDGIGQLPAQKGAFRFFNNEFRHTYIHEVYRSLETAHGFRIGRIRLMCLPPKRCYSVHRDETRRLHVAVETNPGALLIFPEHGSFHVPADGGVYRVDTRLPHSAMNGGDEPRIHLLFNEAED